MIIINRRGLIMGSNPINLVFRFGLEIAALAAFGIWGWNQADGWLKFVLALGIPLLASILWGIFALSPTIPAVQEKHPFQFPELYAWQWNWCFLFLPAWLLSRRECPFLVTC